jgi:hypothetical protein
MDKTCKNFHSMYGVKDMEAAVLVKSLRRDIMVLESHKLILAEVIMDLLSTASLSDVKADTGLPEKRCEEIMAIHQNLLDNTR